MGDEQEKRTKRRRGRRRQHRAKELPNIFFCGDPHGEFAHINEAARLYKPDAMVILGDSQPSAPLEELLGEAMSLTDIWWIPGNHDTDTDEYFDYLWRGPLASHNLHGRVTTVAGLRIAGLGGVFRGQIWMPDEEPNYFSPAHFIRRSPKVNIWRGGLPRRHRSTIFPSVYNYLMHQKADILITHEAPSCHAKGFEALDRLAQSLGVKWFFHGHQHEDRVYGMQNGCLTRAVGFRGIVNLQGEVIVPAQMDPRETVALQEAFDWAARTQAPEGFEPGEGHARAHHLGAYAPGTRRAARCGDFHVGRGARSEDRGALRRSGYEDARRALQARGLRRAFGAPSEGAPSEEGRRQIRDQRKKTSTGRPAGIEPAVSSMRAQALHSVSVVRRAELCVA